MVPGVWYLQRCVAEFATRRERWEHDTVDLISEVEGAHAGIFRPTSVCLESGEHARRLRDCPCPQGLQTMSRQSGERPS